MTRIAAISGSLRRQSFNTALLKAAAALMPEHASLDVVPIDRIPLYDGDVEADRGIPDSVLELKERILASDALLIATPEYNHSFPGVLKNAIDWVSRPPEDVERIFARRPVGVIGASPGYFGTEHAQTAWLPVFRTLRMKPWFDGRLTVARATNVFSPSGQLVDARLRDELRRFLDGFSSFARDEGRNVDGGACPVEAPNSRAGAPADFGV